MPEIKLPELRILKITDLRTHEELNKESLQKIKDSMKLGTFTNPIIVDRNTNVILDGMHRYELLKQLEYDLIPCQLVDYLSDDIEVKSWYLTAYLRGTLDDDISLISDITRRFCAKNGLDIEMMGDSESVLNLVSDSSRPCLWGIIFPESSKKEPLAIRLRKGTHELYEITGLLRKFTDELERGLKKGNSGIIRFHHEERAKHSVDTGEEIDCGRNTYRATCAICRPVIRKHEVIEWAQKKKLFPKKSTRHIIKACRALYINIPFSLLKGRGVSEEKANAELKKRMRDPKYIHRFYVEPILIYDELMYELVRNRKI